MLTIPSRTGIAPRLGRLLGGLTACGVGLTLMVRANLGLGPWEVLHQGISRHTGVPLGTVGILVGFVVLLGWIPLRQRLGVGTITNAIWIGVVIDVGVFVLDDIEPLPLRVAALALGVVLVGLGSGLYIGAGLGPGPRDGLMTGMAARGHSLRSVRTIIEMSALVGGWALGGTVGIGTVAFALAIGPLVQLFLPRLTVVPRSALTDVDTDPPTLTAPVE